MQPVSNVVKSSSQPQASCSLLLRALPQSGNSVRVENSLQAVSPAHREGSRCLERAHCLALGSQSEKHGRPFFSTSSSQTAGLSI